MIKKNKRRSTRYSYYHAANSKDFSRYVSFAQAYIDTEIDNVYKKLSKKKLRIRPEKVAKNQF